MPREQLQFPESCHFQNQSKTKKSLNVADLSGDPGAKDLSENPELTFHMTTEADS